MKNIEFLISLKDKLTSPLKKVLQLKENASKGVTIAMAVKDHASATIAKMKQDKEAFNLKPLEIKTRETAFNRLTERLKYLEALKEKVSNNPMRLQVVEGRITQVLQQVDRLSRPAKFNYNTASINDLQNRMSRLIDIRNRLTDPAKIEKFNTEIAKASAQINKLSNQSGKGFFASALDSAKGFLVAGAITAMTSGMVAFGRESVAAYDSSARVTAQLQAAITSTGGAAGRSLSELQEQADKLAKTTLFDDDATKEAQASLLTYTNIKGKVFDETIPIIQDMATAMAGDGPADLKGASIQIGKALNDPIQGISALSRVGVNFSESQKKMIKSLVETGKTAEAQILILNELKTKFGGSAEAAAQAGLGPLKILQNQFGEVKESIGGLIAEGLLALQPALSNLVEFLEAITEGLQNTVKWIKENSELMATLAKIVGIGAIALGAYALALNASAIGAWAATTATTAWATAQNLLNLAFAANPIGLVIVSITALVAAFAIAYDKIAEFRAFVWGLWEAIKTAFNNIGELAIKVFGNLGTLLKGIFTFDKAAIDEGINGLKKAFSDMGSKLSESYKKGFQGGLDNFVADKVNDELEKVNQIKSNAGKKDYLIERTTEIEKQRRELVEKTKTTTDSGALEKLQFETRLVDEKLKALQEYSQREFGQSITDLQKNRKKKGTFSSEGSSDLTAETGKVTAQAQAQKSITVNINKFGEVNIGTIKTEKQAMELATSFGDQLREELLRAVRNFETVA
jgi:hypothetical protein